MSVRKNQQSPNRFTVLNAALMVYSHTALVVSNPKFEKCKRLAERIEDRAAMIYHCCRSANEDYDNRIAEEAEIRLKLEEEAVEHCKWLKTDIRLAQKRLHLRASKCIFWNNIVNDTMKLIKAWIKTERENLKQIHGL